MDQKKLPTQVFIPLLALLIVAGVGLYVSVAQNQLPVQPSDETAGWQTYRNEEYGISFSYPPDWRLSDDSGYNRAACTESDPACVKYFQAELTHKTKNITLSINTRQCTSMLKLFDGFVICYSGSLSNIPNSAYLGVTENGELLQYADMSAVEAIAAIKKTLELGSAGTPSWQTYRNEEYGFEVKYPPSWEVTPNIGYVGIANSEGGINIDSRIAGYNSTLGRDLTAEDLTLTRGSKVEKTEIILDGVTATKIAYCYGLSPIIGIVAEKYGRFYKIGVEPWNIGGCEDSSGPIIPVFNKSIFNEILSTFKFVESDELSVSELKSESHSQVVLFEKDPITVFLYAPNKEVEILIDPFCAGNKGDKVFKGDYQLISVKSGAIISRLDLNLFSRGLFEGLRHDGLDILNGSKIPLVTITQYASCNGSFTQLFHVDESGTIKPAQFTEVGGVVFQDIFGYQLSIDGENLTNCFYNNADPDVGNVCNIYRFDGENFLFVQKL